MQTPMTGTDMGQHHLDTEIIPRNIGRHPIEHGVGRKSQNNNNTSNENKIADIWNTLLWGRTSWFLTQIGGHPLPLINIFHGSLPGMDISRNNYDHREMVQK